jgi:hypothetical protein
VTQASGGNPPGCFAGGSSLEEPFAADALGFEEGSFFVLFLSAAIGIVSFLRSLVVKTKPFHELIHDLVSDGLVT